MQGYSLKSLRELNVHSNNLTRIEIVFSLPSRFTTTLPPLKKRCPGEKERLRRKIKYEKITNKIQKYKIQTNIEKSIKNTKRKTQLKYRFRRKINKIKSIKLNFKKMVWRLVRPDRVITGSLICSSSCYACIGLLVLGGHPRRGLVVVGG